MSEKNYLTPVTCPECLNIFKIKLNMPDFNNKKIWKFILSGDTYEHTGIVLASNEEEIKELLIKEDFIIDNLKCEILNLLEDPLIMINNKYNIENEVQ